MPTSHWPYQYCQRTGRGPGNPSHPGEDRRITKEADKWSCACNKVARPGHKGRWSKCRCKFVGQVKPGLKRLKDKRFWINLSRKSHYNKKYKLWLKREGLQKRECSARLHGQNPGCTCRVRRESRGLVALKPRMGAGLLKRIQAWKARRHGR